MSEFKQELSRGKQRLNEKFKRDAARLVVEERYSFKAAAAVNVSAQSWPEVLLDLKQRGLGQATSAWSRGPSGISTKSGRSKQERRREGLRSLLGEVRGQVSPAV